MHFSRRERPRNIGREDRLVRACVALSLLLLGSFAALTAGRISTFVLGFAVGFGYFALTAAVAWDPFYARQRIDTRSEVPHAVDPLIDADPFGATELRSASWDASHDAGEPLQGSEPAVDNDAVAAAGRRYTSVLDLTEPGGADPTAVRPGPDAPATTGTPTGA